VIAAEHAGVGAAETYAFDLAAQLARDGRSVELWVFPEVRRAAERRVEGSSAAVVGVPASTAARYRFAMKRLASIHPELVHVNHAVSPVLIAARRSTVSVRFVTDHVLPLRPRYGAAGSFLSRRTRRSATGVVVFSEQNARNAHWSWGDLPVHVIPAGVPEPASSQDRARVRGSLGISDEALVVVSVGRLTRQKRMDVIVRAVARLSSAVSDVHALIVGDGPDLAELRSLAQGLDAGHRVTFTGHRDDVDGLLRASDIYVQASAWEGLCFALLEAMAVGLPVAASDLPVFHEILDGTGAPTVRIGDDEALAGAIRSAAADGGLGGRLRERHAQRYTVERMAARHLAAYAGIDLRRRT
jgi:glycosyltransferase involved in cell wall biosynthesis